MNINSATSATPTKCESIATTLGGSTLGTGVVASLSTLSGYLLKSPVGLGGSALYGAAAGITTGALIAIQERTGLSKLAKEYRGIAVASFIATFFASGAAAWGVTNAALGTQGRFSYSDSLALWGVTVAFGNVLAFAVGCCMGCCCSRPEKLGWVGR